MAAVTMTVTEVNRETGIVDLDADANTEDGDAGDPFYFPNDGKTILYMYANAGAGDTATFTSVLDQYGRDASSKTFTVATGKQGIVGPFAPGRWNNSDGQVQFSLTTKHNSTKLLAVRVTQANRNGE